MSVLATQITSLTIVYSTAYSGADQRQHQSSASLAFVSGIYRWPVNSPHKGPPVTRKIFIIWWRHLANSAIVKNIASKIMLSINSWVPGRSGCEFNCAISNFVSLIGIYWYFSDNTLRWMSRDLIVACQHLCRYWVDTARQKAITCPNGPISKSPYGFIRPQWVNSAHTINKGVYQSRLSSHHIW